jgi:capsule polysaccharide export protein KpsE/RkpR
MEQNFYDSGFSLKNSWKFFYRHRVVLLVVFVAALVASTVVAFLLQERFDAKAVMFPTSSNRVSKSVVVDRYSMDVLDYGIERDCEYALQVLSSDAMMRDVCEHFDLMGHYGINKEAKDKYYRLYEMYRAYVTVKRTEFLGIEIKVTDFDPQTAADIANYITANYDTICTKILAPRTDGAIELMENVANRLQEEIKSTSDPLLLKYKNKELASIQTQLAERKADAEVAMPRKFWVDEAVPSDHKSFPKRLVIILFGTLAAELLCILVLLVAERWSSMKKELQ